jgi:ferredoxin
MPKLASLDFKAQLQRDGVPSPAAGIDLDLVRDCIHCGLCLPKCPTFRTLHHEGDSPRGRMWQIKEAALGLVASINASIAAPAKPPAPPASSLER